jgi:hypothetical protein
MKTTIKVELKSIKIHGYTVRKAEQEAILKAGGAFQYGTYHGSGRWTKAHYASIPSHIEGFDLVTLNNAPRGGCTGAYVAATRPGDKTHERAEYIRQFRKEWRDKVYIVRANLPGNIRKAIEDAVQFVADFPEPENDNRYYIGVYHGCGVYRLIIQTGKIIGSIYGGYHDSCPYGVDPQKWYDAICDYIKERVTGQYTIVKADGSGCQFFLRDSEDSELLAVKEYDVPAYPCGIHHNIQIAI